MSRVARDELPRGGAAETDVAAVFERGALQTLLFGLAAAYARASPTPAAANFQLSYNGGAKELSIFGDGHLDITGGAGGIFLNTASSGDT